MFQNNVKRIFIASFVVVFLVGGYLLVSLAKKETQTIDEGVHISAGYSYLLTNDFRLNPEHPPLAKQLAAVPLLFTRPVIPTENKSWKSGDQWQFARDFLYESGNNPQNILFLGRLVIILMTILLGVIISRWTYELYGKVPSLVASILFFSSPIILTHGHLITTDIPVALGVTATAYFFTKGVQANSLKWLIWTGVACAFSADVKFTGVVLFALVPILYAIIHYSAKHRYPHLGLKHFLKMYVLMLFFTIFLALCTTGFQINVSSNDPFLGASHISQAQEFLTLVNPKLAWAPKAYLWILRNVHFIAYPYVSGLLEFITHFEAGHESYFLGTYSDLGSPWYFPVAFFIKTRLAVVILLSLILTLFVKRTFWAWKFKLFAESYGKKIIKWVKSWDPKYVVLVFTPLLFFLSAMQSKVNIGVRHILIVYPFVFILVSALWTLRVNLKKLFKTVITVILGVSIFSTALIWPFPMAYFSEAIGGAPQGYKYLLDSNLDWGQNLPYLKEYLAQQNIQIICLGYFGQGMTTDLGVSIRPLYDNETIQDHEPLRCVVVISAQLLYDRANSFSWLQNRTPNAIIGYGLYIFDLRN